MAIAFGPVKITYSMKLSLIIPVYNVEQYLAKCLDSCILQTASADEYEIIVINDGSPDGSLKIAEDYAKKYGNIHVISQENKGLSGARNKGIDAAKGRYAWFVDSDDWIEKDSVRSILSLLDGSDVVCQTSLFRDKGKDMSVITSCVRGDKGKDIISSMFDAKAQLYIFNIDFLKKHNLFFKQGIYHEDLQFTPRALYLAETARSLDKPLYHYFLRENSISTSVNPKRVKDLINTFKDLECFAQKRVLLSDMDNWIKNVLNRVLIHILHLNRSVEDECLHEHVRAFVNNSQNCDYLAKSDSFIIRMIARSAKMIGGDLYKTYNLITKYRFMK